MPTCRYGELAPGHETKGFFTCSTDCVTAMPCFSASCVTTPYRKYVNQPTELLNSIILPHLKQQGLSGSKGMDAASLSRTQGRTIWSMFSFEHLAGCCPERAFGKRWTLWCFTLAAQNKQERTDPVSLSWFCFKYCLLFDSCGRQKTIMKN